MPYIKEADRERLKPILNPLLNAGLSEGEATYVICLLGNTLYGGGDYATKVKWLAVLESAKLEYYRRVLVPHEERKRELNGEVFE